MATKAGEAFRLTHKWMPVIQEDLCLGCELCVSACGPECLRLEDGVAVLAAPEACRGGGHCLAVCPNRAIRMAWIPWEGNPSRGKWGTGPESACAARGAVGRRDVQREAVRNGGREPRLKGAR